MNYSRLAVDQQDDFDYDISKYRKDGFNKCFKLNPLSDEYKEVKEICEKHGLEFIEIDGKGKQIDIWVKGWKDTM